MGVNNFCMLHKADICCFQETKLAQVSDGILRSLIDSQYMDWVVFEATGSAGGILIGWYCQKWGKISVTSGICMLTVILKAVSDGQVIAVTNVYGPNHATDRQRLWDELKAFRDNFDGIWVLLVTSMLQDLLVKEKGKELTIKTWKNLVILSDPCILLIFLSKERSILQKRENTRA